MATTDNAITEAWARRDWRATLYLTAPRVDSHSLALRSHALSWCGRHADARDAAEHALAVATTVDERAVAMGAQLKALLVIDHERAQALLATLPDRTHPELVQIVHWVELTRAREDGRNEEALGSIEALEAEASQRHDMAGLAHCWSLRAEILLRAGRTEEALLWSERAVRSCDKPGLEALRVRYQIIHTQCLGQAKKVNVVGFWLGLLGEVDEYAPWSAPFIRSSLASHLAELGRFDEAIPWAAEATQLARRDYPFQEAILTVAELWVHVKAERLDTTPAIASRLLDAPQLRDPARRLAVIALLIERIAAGEVHQARRELSRRGEEALALGVYPPVLQPTLNLIAAAFEEAGDVAGAMTATSLALRCWNEEEEVAKCRARLDRLRGPSTPIPVGPHLLHRLLGRGGMGEVWLAEGAAVKWLHLEGKDKSAHQAFRTEVEAVAVIAHDHIVPVFDTGSLGLAASVCLGLPADTPYLAMQAASHTVTSELKEMSWARAREILEAVLDALAAAHARGLLHLDVKPDNVLVSGRHIWLADFGLTSAVGKATEIAGTPTYMAPERYRGEALGVEADLYSVGCMAWEFVTGAPPFVGAPDVVLRHHQSTPLPPLTLRMDVPAGVVDWLETLLRKSPMERPPAAGTAARMLVEACRTPLRAVEPPAGASHASEASSGDSVGTFRFSATFSLDALPTGVFEQGSAASAPGPVSGEQWATAAARAPLDDWRHVRRGDVARPSADPLILSMRDVPVLGHEELKDALWRRAGEVHTTGEPCVVELVGLDDDGASELSGWLADTARRSGCLGVVMAPTLSARFDTTVVVLDDASSKPDAVAAALRFVDAECSLFLVLATRRDERSAATAYQRALDGVAYDRLSVEPLPPATLARRLSSVVTLDPSFAGALARRVGGNTGRARAALLHWHRQGLLVPDAEGIVLRDRHDASEEPLPAMRTGHLDGLSDAVLRGLELLALALGPVGDEAWARVLAMAELPPPIEVARLWWQQGRLERRGRVWHLRSASLRHALVASAESHQRARAGYELWLQAWQGHEPARAAQLELELGRYEQAFEPLLAMARRLAVDARSAEASLLAAQLRRGAEARMLDDDDPERVAVDVLRVALAGASLAELEALAARVEGEGEDHDRAWLQLLLASAQGASQRQLAHLERAAEVGQGSYIGAIALERIALLAWWGRLPDREARLQAATEAWRARDEPGRACHVEAQARTIGGDAEGAMALARQALAHDLSAWPELEMHVASQLGWLLEAAGDMKGAHRAYQAAVRAGSGEGREAAATLGLARLRLWDGQLTAIETARRLRRRLGEHPVGLLSACIVCLAEDPVDEASVRQVMAHGRVLRGHVVSFDRMLRTRELLGRPTEGLQGLRRELVAALAM